MWNGGLTTSIRVVSASAAAAARDGYAEIKNGYSINRILHGIFHSIYGTVGIIDAINY
jgi:hypothetical protein